MKQETLEQAAEKRYPFEDGFQVMDIDISEMLQLAFINGAKEEKDDCVNFINKLEKQSFEGWSEEAIRGYLTACNTIKLN